MKQTSNQSQNTKQDPQSGHQVNREHLQCSDRLLNHFSKVMEMQLPYPSTSQSRVEEIQDKMRNLFKIDIEDGLAKEFFLLTFAIHVNDFYYGYSKHNYTKADWIYDNMDKIKKHLNIPDVKEIERAEVRYKIAPRFSPDRRKGRSEMIQTILKIVEDYNHLMEECIELVRLNDEEVVAENIEEEKKLSKTGGTDKKDELLFPAILDFQIKIKTNFPDVISSIKQYVDFVNPEKDEDDSSKLEKFTKLQNVRMIVGKENNPKYLEKDDDDKQKEDDLLDSFKDTYIVKSKDIGENQWVIEAIRDKGIEKEAEQIDAELLIPQIEEPYHSMVRTLYDYIDEVFSKSNTKRNRRIANWILAEAGILINDVLFEKINGNNEIDDTPYGTYKEYLESVNPTRKR